MQGIDREDDAGQAQVPDQGSRALNLRGHIRHLLMAEDQRRVRGEGAEHVGRGAIGQPVEAAPQRLAVQCHGAPRLIRPGAAEVPGMAPEGCFQLLRVERQEQVAQRVDRRRAAQARAEGPVEPVAVDAQEGDDAAVGGRAREHGQHREQQQVGERIAPALRAARVGDLRQGGQQGGERDHSDLRQACYRINTSAAGPLPPHSPALNSPAPALRTTSEAGRIDRNHGCSRTATFDRAAADLDDFHAL